MGAADGRAAVRFRRAGAGDAQAIGALHADSWRRYYRGAYSDAFLDGDVLTDRVSVWTQRLSAGEEQRATIVAEKGGLIGFAHVVFDEDPTWGALLDNLHVADGHKRGGIGSQLMRLSAQAVAASAEQQRKQRMYLWVLEQNLTGQAFYAALGGSSVERAAVTPPGGVAGRLAGAPAKLRYAWPALDPLLAAQDARADG